MSIRIRVWAALAILFGCTAGSAAAQIRLEYGVNRGGHNYYQEFHASTAESCAAVCNNAPACRAMVWSQASQRCRLQQYVHPPSQHVCCVSGVKSTAPPPYTGYPAECASYPRASLHFVNRQPYTLRLLVNGQRMRDVGPYGQNAERHVLPPGRNTIQIVLPNNQYMTKYVIVVNHGVRTCSAWANVSYP